MKIKPLLKAIEKYAVDNSPGIFTGFGVAGAITTAVLAARTSYRVGMDASTQYHEAVVEGEELPAELLEPKHLVTTYWKEYIPAAISGVTTVTCIIMANHIGARRAAAMTAAFKLSEKMAEEYRQKVVDELGAKGEEKVRTKVATDRVAQTPGSELVIITGPEQTFFDEWSGRYFKAEIENVRQAVNEINYQINNSYYASLTDLYDKIGLPRTAESDEFGWNSDELLEMTYTAVLDPSNKPVIAINYNQKPIRGYCRVS